MKIYTCVKQFASHLKGSNFSGREIYLKELIVITFLHVSNKFCYRNLYIASGILNKLCCQQLIFTKYIVNILIYKIISHFQKYQRTYVAFKIMYKNTNKYFLSFYLSIQEINLILMHISLKKSYSFICNEHHGVFAWRGFFMKNFLIESISKSLQFCVALTQIANSNSPFLT